MPVSSTRPESRLAPPAAESPGPAPELDSLTRSLRREIGVIVGIALIMFLVAIKLPLGQWLAFVMEHRGYVLDELIFVFLVLSFVFPVFFVRRWLDLRREVTARANLIARLEHNARMDAQLSQLTNLLHSCVTPDEANKIVSHYARQLFPNNAGALYVFKSSRNLVEIAAEWGDSEPHEPAFAPDQCWALRQGQLYEVQNPQVTVICPHARHPGPYVCLPMMAHGEVLALLHVHSGAGADVTSDAGQRLLLRTFAEQIALALSNLKLRDALRQQSVRDPLTGLFNRRYLEETLAIEIARAKRNGEPFSFVMLDLDHFKRFNDTHGHEAGDAVLQAIGRFLQRFVRGGDIACRYGGEEFSLILPGTSLPAAQQRAVQLCEEIRALRVEFRGESLGPLTLSAGVATFPDHGETVEFVLQTADMALYQAKAAGRDRAVVAGA
jgi:diguanylate cyclase (GGDEF)-like protein